MDVYFNSIRDSLRAIFDSKMEGSPPPKGYDCRILDPVTLTEELGACKSILLYGDEKETLDAAGHLIKDSDGLIALVGCGKLAFGHRQVSMEGIGDPNPHQVEKLGFVPDLVVAKCKGLKDACRLLEWTVLGSRLICMIAPKSGEHGSWSIAKAFELQAFCTTGGTFIVRKAEQK